MGVRVGKIVVGFCLGCCGFLFGSLIVVREDGDCGVIATTTTTRLQFDCTNTLNDQMLEEVTVQMENQEGFEVLRCVPAASLPYGKPGSTYTLVQLPDDPTLGSLSVVHVVVVVVV